MGNPGWASNMMVVGISSRSGRAGGHRQASLDFSMCFVPFAVMSPDAIATSSVGVSHEYTVGSKSSVAGGRLRSRGSRLGLMGLGRSRHRGRAGLETC
jgi:hypothetical protein